MSTVVVEGREVRLTNLDKVLWPQTGFTKGHLVEYAVQTAEVTLRHAGGHPLTLHRFPDGVDGPHWYETRCPPHPEWVRTQRMYTFTRSGKVVDACVADDVATLVWLAQIAAVELHPFLGRAGDLEHPRWLVFDLDPGPGTTVADAARVALRVRDVLDGLGLASFPKTSGAKGVHVHVALAPGHTYDRTKAFAHAVAGLLVRDDPGRVTSLMAREERGGKVFVDWSQNDHGKTTVAPYSLRGLPVPIVATPLTWDEVEAGALGPFGPDDVVARLDAVGDLFEPAAARPQELPGR